MKASQRLYKKAVIMHNAPAISEDNALVIDQILQLTLYDGMTHDQASKSMRQLGRELTTCFFVVRGAWCVVRGAADFAASSQPVFQCLETLTF